MHGSPRTILAHVLFHTFRIRLLHAPSTWDGKQLKAAPAAEQPLPLSAIGVGSLRYRHGPLGCAHLSFGMLQ